MVRSLAALFEDLDRPAGLSAASAITSAKQLAADQSRTRTGHQHAVGLEHLEHGQVEFQVALREPARRRPDCLAYLGGSQMTTPNACLPAAFRRSRTSQHVAFFEWHAGQAVDLSVWRPVRSRLPRAVDP